MDLYGDGSALPVQSLAGNVTEENSQAAIVDPSQSFMEDIMPASLEFLSEDTSTITPQTMPSVGHALQNPVSQAADDLGFLVSEDSIALSEAHFEQLSNYVDNSTVSPCFSKSQQLACEDTTDSLSREPAPVPHFDNCRGQNDNDEFLLATAEETSMDSGLGSVESAYPNSEEESTGILSPDASQPLPSTSTMENVHPTVPQSHKNAEDSNSRDIVFYDCLSEAPSDQNAKKRTHDSDPTSTDQPQSKKQKTERKVSFENVTVFYFPRKQGFVSVPSQGGSTLGMSMRHIDHSTMTIQEHYHDMKQRHKQKIREHMREQKIENKIKQLKFMNPELDNGTLSSMARNAVGEIAASRQQDDDSLLENFDEFFFLQPITAKKRRKILRLAGVERIDGEEKFANRILRESRELCGCSCQQVCIPETCECALSGIQCQVDRESFPCGCVASGCQNENGRIEFDSERVRVHLLATLQKLQQHDADSQNVFGAEQTASSESECDFMSSDDAEQSDSEVPDSIQCPQSFTTISTLAVTSPDHNPAETEATEIPQEYLETLGLKKVEIRTESNESPLISNPTLFPVEQNLYHPVQHTASYEQYCNLSNACSFNSIESLAQSVPDPLPPPRQMYGTTSPESYCQGASVVTRDFSIPLEPIATFMTTNYNIATSDSVTCRSSF